MLMEVIVRLLSSVVKNQQKASRYERNLLLRPIQYSFLLVFTYAWIRHSSIDEFLKNVLKIEINLGM